jgi:flagellar P-ring protein precursor FlgI
MLKKFLLICALFVVNYAQTIKDISNIVGIRDNQLIGYGLVVGLAGTGDKSKFAMQSLKNLLQNSYIKIPTSSIKSKNIASVMVTATLPPFSRQGDKINLNISSLGDAKSIDNGQLLLTQLKGLNGEVYAIAQGTVVANNDNPTTGYIYEGAIIENEIDFPLKDETKITLSLIKQSAKNATLVEKKINEKFNLKIAQALDTRTIEVKRPEGMSMVSLIADIQNIKINSDISKKVVIDVVKGIIVSGADIVIQPITITRKNFTLRIKKQDLSKDDWNDPLLNVGVDIGDNVKIGNKPTQINFNNALVNTQSLPTVSDLMRALKLMKLDLREIIQTIVSIKNLGAIEAEIEVIR